MEACYRQGLTLWWKESACSTLPTRSAAVQSHSYTMQGPMCVCVSVPKELPITPQPDRKVTSCHLVNWDKPGTGPKASQLEYRREQYHVHRSRIGLERSSGKSHLIVDSFFHWINCSLTFSKQDIMLSTWLVNYSFLSILLLSTFIFILNLCQGFVWLLYSHSFLYSLTEHEIHPKQSQ